MSCAASLKRSVLATELCEQLCGFSLYLKRKDRWHSRDQLVEFGVTVDCSFCVHTQDGRSSGQNVGQCLGRRSDFHRTPPSPRLFVTQE